MIIDAQFGLLTVGITPACSVYAPSFIIRPRVGVFAVRIPSGLSPSTPTMTTCSTRETCGPVRSPAAGEQPRAETLLSRKRRWMPSRRQFNDPPT